MEGDLLRRYLDFIQQQFLQIVDPATRKVATAPPSLHSVKHTPYNCYNLNVAEEYGAAVAAYEYKLAEISKAHHGNPPPEAIPTPPQPLGSSPILAPSVKTPLGITDPTSLFSFQQAILNSPLQVLFYSNYLAMDYLAKQFHDREDRGYQSYNMDINVDTVSGIRGYLSIAANTRDGYGYNEERRSNRSQTTDKVRKLVFAKTTPSGSICDDSYFDFGVTDPHARIFSAVAPFMTYMPAPINVRNPDSQAEARDAYYSSIATKIHVWRGNYVFALGLLRAFDLLEPPTEPVPNYEDWMRVVTPTPILKRIFDWLAFNHEPNYWPSAWSDLANRSDVRGNFTKSYQNATMSFSEYNLTPLFYRYIAQFYWKRMVHRLERIHNRPCTLPFFDYEVVAEAYLPIIPEDGPYMPDDAAKIVNHIFSYSFFSMLLEIK